MSTARQDDGSQTEAQVHSPSPPVSARVRELLREIGSDPVSAYDLLTVLRSDGMSQRANRRKRTPESARMSSGGRSDSDDVGEFTETTASKTAGPRARSTQKEGGKKTTARKVTAKKTTARKVTAKKTTARKPAAAKRTARRRAVRA